MNNPSGRRGSNARFRGVFTLKTPEQVSQLAAAVQALIENSVNVCAYLAERNQDELNKVLNNMTTISKLSAEFEDLLTDDEDIKQIHLIIHDMNAVCADCAHLFNNHNYGGN